MRRFPACLLFPPQQSPLSPRMVALQWNKLENFVLALFSVLV